MPNRLFRKFASSHESPPQPGAPAPEGPAPRTGKTLVTGESAPTNASEIARDAKRDSRELAGAIGTAAKQRSLGRSSERASSSSRFARIRGLLPSSKTSSSVSGLPPPAPGQGQAIGSGAATGTRSSATGSATSGGALSWNGVGVGEQAPSQENMDAAGGTSRLQWRQKSPTAHDKTGRWWTCLAPSRLREGEPQTELGGMMLDTHASSAATRPSDLFASSSDMVGQVQQQQPEPHQTQVPQHHNHHNHHHNNNHHQNHHNQQHQPQSSNLGVGGGAEGSVGASGPQADSERFNRVRKTSGRNIRLSLERNLQNKNVATRNGSGPGGTVSGGQGSAVLTTNESKPRDSFESDWDVMGAENDGNALSALAVAMSTNAGLDGNSGGINAAAAGGGSRGPTAIMAAVAVAMANASSGGGGGGGAGSEAASSGRQQSKMRKGPTAPRSSRDSKENPELGDTGQQQKPPQALPRLQQQQQQQWGSEAEEGGGGGGGERMRRGMRSPTSSSNMAVDLSFNPNLQHLTLQRVSGTVAGSSAGRGAKPSRIDGSFEGTGSLSGGGSIGRILGAGIDRGGSGSVDGSSRNGRPTPEDLLAAQMMALQNRINALTDEDLLNPSAALPFVSSPPSQAVPMLSAHTPLPQLASHTLETVSVAGCAPLPYQMASSGSGAGLGVLAALHAGSSTNLNPTALQQPQFSSYLNAPLPQQNPYMAQHPQQPQQQQQQNPLQQQLQQQALQQHPHQYPQYRQQQQQQQQLTQHQQQAPASMGLPPMSGMGALDALSAFLGSPPSRAASVYDGGGGLLMTTGATGGARASAGSPGSLGAGGPSSSARSVGGVGGVAAAAGIRSMQSINEDGFLGAAANQAGGSSYRLASSHLGGPMGGGATSNSSFLSIRPGAGSDDPGGMLSTRDDAGLTGPSSRGHMPFARSSETDMMQPHGHGHPMEHGAKSVCGPGNMIIFTRGSSLGDRHSLLAVGPVTGAGGGVGGTAAGDGAAAAPTSRPTVGDGGSVGTVAQGDVPWARSHLPPITTPPAGAGGAGASRFTLAAALSPFQEELLKSIVAPTPGAAGAPSVAVGAPSVAVGAAAAATSSVGSGDGVGFGGSGPTASRQLLPAISSSRSAAGSGAASTDGTGSATGAIASAGSCWANAPVGTGPAALAATVLARDGGPGGGGGSGGLPGELGSSNSVTPSGPFARVSARRGAGATPSSQSHHQSEGPDLLNSGTLGNLNQFAGRAAGGEPSPHGHGVSHPHHYPQQHAHGNQPQPSGGGTAAAAAAGRGATPLMPSRGPQPRHDVPAGAHRSSTDYLYDEFLGNAPSQYDMITHAAALPGGPLGGPGTLALASTPLESTDAGMAYGLGGAAGNTGASTALGPGPPPIQGRSVRRNVSAESLRIQAAHRSMEGRAAAAAAGVSVTGVGLQHAGGVAQWGGPAPPSPLSSSGGGRPPSPQAAQHQQRLAAQGAGPGHIKLQQQQQQRQDAGYSGNHASPTEGQKEPTSAQANPDATAAAAAAAAVAASSTAAMTATQITGGGIPGVGRSYGVPRGCSPSGNGSSMLGSSSGTVGPELQLPTAMPPPLSLTGSGVGSGLFLDGAISTRYPVESVRAAATATAAAAVTGETNSSNMVSNGGYAGGLLSSTDAVVAGLMESVLRSGATATLQDDALDGGTAAAPIGAASPGDGATTAAAAAQGLAILSPIPGRNGIVGGGAAAGRTANGAPGLPPPFRGRPNSGGMLTGGRSTSLMGGAAAPGLGAGSPGIGGGGPGTAAATGGAGSSPSLEALMAFRDESGRPLVQLMTPADIVRLDKKQPLLREQKQQQEYQQQQEQDQQQHMLLQRYPHATAGAARPSSISFAGLDVILGPRPQYGVCEILLLAAGALVVLFNLIVVVYVLVSVQLIELRPGDAAGSAGGGAGGSSGHHFSSSREL